MNPTSPLLPLALLHFTLPPTTPWTPPRLKPLRFPPLSAHDETNPIPTGGYSLADRLNKPEQFETSLTALENYMARIDTMGNVETRWVVSTDEGIFLIDVPPYSDELAGELKGYTNSTGVTNGLTAILVTNRQCIHDSTELDRWIEAFPGVKVMMYRLDVPREWRTKVTQVLDGYGPWGWDGEGMFVENGRPLTVEEWDEDTRNRVVEGGELPPEVFEESNDEAANELQYSKAAIREREQKYQLLAVYTPGHTFGSVTYIFPERGICCSGYALPLETNDSYDDVRAAPRGPRLDYRGYLATSMSRPRQMSSASTLIADYIDRFNVVLPACGDAVFLDGQEEIRRRELLESVGLYRKIGEIYGRLGIAD